MKLLSWLKKREEIAVQWQIRGIDFSLLDGCGRLLDRLVGGIDPFVRGELLGKNSIEVLENLQKGYLGKLEPLTKSETLKTVFSLKVKEDYGKIVSALLNATDVDLSKAVKDSDWNKILRSHDESQPHWVDPSTHLIENPAPKTYQDFLSSPVQNKGVPSPGGISAKMIHSVKDSGNNTDTYMAKPYFKAIESHSKGWIKHPILGWATMATKGLFNAGGIGHLAEDVSTATHQGVPLTVHKFSPDFEGVRHLFNSGHRDVDHLALKQIGIMDFLTNNNDRHGDNLMMGKFPDETGKHPLLAIDHERNFQYGETPAKHLGRDDLKRQFDEVKPHDFTRSGAWQLHDWARQDAGHPLKMKPDDKHPEWYETENKLADWWTKNRDNLKSEFERQLTGIKDENVRKHIRDNFDARVSAINNWSNDATHYGAENLEPLFSPLNPVGADTIQMKSDRPLKVKALLDKLPQSDPVGAVHNIALDLSKRDRLTGDASETLRSAVNDLVWKMSPEELMELHKSLTNNPLYKTKLFKGLGVRGHIAGVLAGAHPNKEAHRQIFTDRYDNLPASEEKDYIGHILPVWRAPTYKKSEDLEKAIGLKKKPVVPKTPAEPVVPEKPKDPGMVTALVPGRERGHYGPRLDTDLPTNFQTTSITKLFNGNYHLAAHPTEAAVKAHPELKGQVIHRLSPTDSPDYGDVRAAIMTHEKDGKKYIRAATTGYSANERDLTDLQKAIQINPKYNYEPAIALDSKKDVEKGWETQEPNLIHGLVPDVSLHSHPGSITKWLSFAAGRGEKEPRALVKEAMFHPDGLSLDRFEASDFCHPTFTSAHREAAYKKMADDVFGLGDYVPKTTVFRHPLSNQPWSAQEFLPGGIESASPSDLAGVDIDDRHKLGVMNMILGNNDRHSGNLGMDSSGYLKLIDNALSFDYAGVGGWPVPHYIKDSDGGTLPHSVSGNVKTWLQSLDPKKFADGLQKMGATHSIIELATKRLVAAKTWGEKHANEPVRIGSLIGAVLANPKHWVQGFGEKKINRINELLGNDRSATPEETDLSPEESSSFESVPDNETAHAPAQAPLVPGQTDFFRTDWLNHVVAEQPPYVNPNDRGGLGRQDHNIPKPAPLKGNTSSWFRTRTKKRSGS